MTAESAVAIAGGFTPRAQRNAIKLTRVGEEGAAQAVVPPGTFSSPAIPSSSPSGGSDDAPAAGRIVLRAGVLHWKGCWG
jgi:protein involved in polysaccharide export with SLBB domain